MKPSASVSGSEVIALFAGRSASAKRRLLAWRADPSKHDVVPFVESHVSNVVLSVTPADIECVAESTEHALGETKRIIGEGTAAVRDWHPAFAFTHVMHAAAEAYGAVPTYQEMRRLLGNNPNLRPMLWDPAQKLIAELSPSMPNVELRAAMRWRIGNAYYSFIRELYVVAVLRGLDVPVLLHPLADALFRVDLWSGSTVASLFVGNTRYRTSDVGRKQPALAILGDANPPFRFVDLELDTQHRFGVVHLPSKAAIEGLAAKFTDLET